MIASSSRTKKNKGNKSKKIKKRVPKTSGGVSKNKGKKKLRRKAKENVSIAKERDIGKEIVLSSLNRSKERTRLEKVRLSQIYLFLNVLKVHLIHEYWIQVLVVTYVLPCRI